MLESPRAVGRFDANVEPFEAPITISYLVVAVLLSTKTLCIVLPSSPIVPISGVSLVPQVSVVKL